MRDSPSQQFLGERVVPRRCAIYTRKSSEEGLEQSFNSLDAQREACEAFIRSQAHEGWQVLPVSYDDGGFSGGTISRPALARLLEDIEQGRIDVVVVYKVDRLSRSLADFVQLVQLFDETNVSFVSVTQQFNTSSSMGRLTLNVLLSFAQFEREVTSERIRDKIAASKKKGMWMGGLVPLGYDRVDKQLVVNEKEAELVRHIYQRYLVLGNVRDLKAELDAEGYSSKARPTHHVSPGNQPFARGALYTILKNPIYLGKVRYKEELHPGQHAAIVETGLWKAVQKALASNRKKAKTRATVKHPSLLAGLVYDDQGNRMSPTYTRRKNTHYAYYVSQALLQFKHEEAGSVVRIPSKELENSVIQLLFNTLINTDTLLGFLAPYQLDGQAIEKATSAAIALTEQWPELELKAQIPIVETLISKVVVGKQEIAVTLQRDKLAEYLVGDQAKPTNDDKGNSSEIMLRMPVELRRSGIEAKLVYPSQPLPTAHKRSVKALQAAVLQAMKWNEELLSGKVRSMDALIERDGLNSRQTYRLRKLAFLAPDIIDAIITGDISETLTLERLKQDFPLDWQAQRTYFKFT